MARQLPELDELLSNYIADDDLILVRDTSAKQDKRTEVSALLSYFIANLPEEVITTALIDNNAVTRDKINSKAVGVDEIDFDDFDSKFPCYNGNTSNNNINKNAWYDQKTYTVEYDGVYFIEFNQEMTSGENSNDLSVRIVKNNTEIKIGSSGGSSWVNYTQAVVIAIVKCSKNDIIKLQSKGGGSNSYSTRYGHYTIARIR